jgi:molybdopterin/thiamine biosynthesis adenylyltransferase
MRHSGVQVVVCPSVEVFCSDAGDLYLVPAPGLEQKVVRAPYGVPLLAALQSLGAGRTVTSALMQVQPNLRPLFEPVFAELLELGYLRPRSRADASAQFDRQQRYWCQLGMDPDTAQERLREACVVVLGVGGVGGLVAETLVRSGVGSVALVDCDVVAIENLPRQLLYGPPDVGHAKVEVAARRMRWIDPTCSVAALDARISCAEDVGRILDRVHPDLLLNSADTPQWLLAEWIDDACFSHGVPWSTAGQRPPEVSVGPLCVPGRTPCRACCTDAEANPADMSNTAQLRQARAANGFVVPAVGYADQLAASLMCADAIALLTGGYEPATLGAVYRLDTERFIGSIERAGCARAQCARCGGADVMPPDAPARAA